MLTRTEIKLIAEQTAKELADMTIPIMDTKRCAEYLHITENAVRKRVTEERIPYHKKHGNLYFSKLEIDKYYLKDD